MPTRDLAPPVSARPSLAFSGRTRYTPVETALERLSCRCKRDPAQQSYSSLTLQFAPPAASGKLGRVVYRFLADMILVVHTTFIAFVLFGLIAIVAGWVRGWTWVRNGWFRALHLAAIGYVVAQAWFGMVCPLTTWENHLRVRGGPDPYASEGFIAYWLHRLIFFEADPWVFTICYTAFGLVVAATLILVPPRWRRRRRPDERAKTNATAPATHANAE